MDSQCQGDNEAARPGIVDERSRQSLLARQADRERDASFVLGLPRDGLAESSCVSPRRSSRWREDNGTPAEGDPGQQTGIAQFGSESPASPIEAIEDHAEMIFGLAALALIGWLAITCVAWAFTPSNTQRRAAANRADWEARRPVVAEKPK